MNKILKVIITGLVLTSNTFLLIPKPTNAAAGDLVVTSTNMPPYNIITNPGHVIQLKFNYDIKVKNPSDVKILQEGTPVATTYAAVGNKLYVYPTNLFDQHKYYTLYLRNIKDTSSSHPFKPYSLTFRMTKYSPTVIGQTESNNDIKAYTIGNGSQKILLVGSMHGDERNANDLLHKTVSYLDANDLNIPADRQVIVVPLLNVDGYLAKSRFNANHVDLNRNWDTDDWEKDSYIGNQKIVNGGGLSRGSEIETQVLATLMTTHRPLMTISYHSAAAYVISNGKNLSGYRAKSYAGIAGYRYIPFESSDTDGFNYKITGDFTVWAREESLNAFTVELRTKTEDDYSQNIKGIWYIITM